MMRRIFIFALLSVTITTGCRFFSKYPGYTRTLSGIHYKLLKIGDSLEKASVGDFVTVDLKYKTILDSTFFVARRKFQVMQPEYKGSINECITMLTKEESAIFIISARDFFSKTIEAPLPAFIKDDEMMKIEIEVLDIQTEKEYAREREAFLKWIDDFNEYEKTILQHFLEEEALELVPTKSGLYYILLKEGTGKIVQPGDTITIHYEGRFLNGKFFDSTIKRNEPFQFIMGQEWQVIKGMEEGIALMKEGEKALFIMPSGLAFGHEGSSTGIIPPYTSIIFEVELLKVN